MISEKEALEIIQWSKTQGYSESQAIDLVNRRDHELKVAEEAANKTSDSTSTNPSEEDLQIEQDAIDTDFWNNYTYSNPSKGQSGHKSDVAEGTSIPLFREDYKKIDDKWVWVNPDDKNDVDDTLDPRTVAELNREEKEIESIKTIFNLSSKKDKKDKSKKVLLSETAPVLHKSLEELSSVYEYKSTYLYDQNLKKLNKLDSIGSDTVAGGQNFWNENPKLKLEIYNENIKTNPDFKLSDVTNEVIASYMTKNNLIDHKNYISANYAEKDHAEVDKLQNLIETSMKKGDVNKAKKRLEELKIKKEESSNLDMLVSDKHKATLNTIVQNNINNWQGEEKAKYKTWLNDLKDKDPEAYKRIVEKLETLSAFDDGNKTKAKQIKSDYHNTKRNKKLKRLELEELEDSGELTEKEMETKWKEFHAMYDGAINKWDITRKINNVKIIKEKVKDLQQVNNLLNSGKITEEEATKKKENISLAYEGGDVDYGDESLNIKKATNIKILKENKKFIEKVNDPNADATTISMQLEDKIDEITLEERLKIEQESGDVIKDASLKTHYAEQSSDITKNFDRLVYLHSHGSNDEQNGVVQIGNGETHTFGDDDGYIKGFDEIIRGQAFTEELKYWTDYATKQVVEDYNEFAEKNNLEKVNSPKQLDKNHESYDPDLYDTIKRLYARKQARKGIEGYINAKVKFEDKKQVSIEDMGETEYQSLVKGEIKEDVEGLSTSISNISEKMKVIDGVARPIVKKFNKHADWLEDNSYEDIEEKIGDIKIEYNFTEVEAKIKRIQEKKYTTQEEADAANVEIFQLRDGYNKGINQINTLTKNYNYHLNGINELSDDVHFFYEQSEKLRNKGLEVSNTISDLNHLYGESSEIQAWNTKLAVNSYKALVNTMVGLEGLAYNELREISPSRAAVYHQIFRTEEGREAQWIYKASGGSMGLSVLTAQENIASMELSTQHGDFGDDTFGLGEYVAHSITDQAPLIAMTLLGVPPLAAAGTMGLSVAGHDLNTTLESNQLGLTEYTGTQRWISATTKGSLEVVSEYILAGQVNRLGKGILTDIGIKKGAKNYLMNSLKIGGFVALEGSQEALGEGFNQFGSNVVDKYLLKKNVGLMDGVPRAALDGFLVSGGMKTPMMIKQVLSPMISQSMNSKLDFNSNRLISISKLLENKELTEERRLDLEREQNELVNESNDIIDEGTRSIAGMDDASRQELLEISRKKAQLLAAADNIRNQPDDKMKVTEKKEELDKLKDKYNSLESTKEDILNKDRRTQEERDSDYNNILVKIRDKARKYRERTGKKVNIFEMNSRQIAEEQLERLSIFQQEIDFQQEILDGKRQTRDGKFLDPKDKNNTHYINAKRLLNEFKSQYAETANAHNEYGMIGSDKFGEHTIIVNSETSRAAGGRVTTAMHEFLHATLFRTIGRDGNIQSRLGNALIDFVAKKHGGFSKAFIDRMDPYIGSSQYGEEVMTIMSESIMDGSLKYDEGFFVKVGDIIRRSLQNSGLKDIKFNTGRDVYNFIKDYNHTIEKNYDSKAIDRVMDRGATGKLVTGKGVSQVDGQYFSKSSNLQDLHDGYKGDKNKLVRDGLKYDNKGNEVKDTELDKSILGKAMAKIAGRITKRLYDPIPVSERQGITREMYMNELLKLGGVMIRQEYDATKQSLDRFVSNRLNNRAESLAKKLGVRQGGFETTNIEDAKNVGVDPVDTTVSYETVDNKPTMEDRLVAVDPRLQVYTDEMRTNINNGLDMLLSNEAMNLELQDTDVDPEVRSSYEQQIEANNIELEALGMKDFDITKQDYKSLKDLNPEATQRMFGIIPKPGVLRVKGDIPNAQRFINEHSNALAAGLPQGHIPTTKKSTGVNKVLLEPFYNKRSVRAGTKAGEFVQTKKPISAIISKFKSIFGVTERGQPNLAKKETNVSQRIKALVAQTGKTISNQMVREFLIKSGNVDAKLMVAISDGKSDMMFSKKPASAIHADKVIALMESNPALKTRPHDAVRLASELYGIPIDEFGGLADKIENRINKNLGNYNFSELTPMSVTPSVLDFDSNWDGFIKRKRHGRYAPLSKTNAKDKAMFIAQSTSFLNKFPTVWLKNPTFKAIFANSTKGDFFYRTEELDAVINEIIKARKSNPNFVEPSGGNLVTSGLKFDAKLMDKITNVTTKYDNPEYDSKTKEWKVKEITKDIDAIIEKSGSSANDMRAGLTFVMSQLNSFLNESGLSKTDKTNRGKFITTLLQNQTSKTTGIIRGAAFFKMISITPGKDHSKTVRGNIGNSYLKSVLGMSDISILLIGNPKANIKKKHRLKGESISDARKRLEKEIENALTPVAKENGFTYKEYREMMKEGMTVTKPYHGEHIIALLLMTTNTFDSMVQGTFESKFPDIIRYTIKWL